MGFPSKRKKPTLELKPVVFYIPEGKTERNYIKHLQSILKTTNSSNLQYIDIRKDSCVPALIKEAKKITTKLKKKDTIWIILDEDSESHTPEQMEDLRTWANSNAKHRYILNKPRFEAWLLAHFPGKLTRDNASNNSKVARHIPSYRKNKAGNLTSITPENVKTAIAKMKKCNPNSGVYSNFHEFIEHCFDLSL